MSLTPTRAKVLEAAFVAAFSAVVLCVFFSVISMNGLVMGNDPAVHLEKAQIFLQTGRISLANLGWTPPLYSILLTVFAAFTGATGLEQLILNVKIVAVIADWLLFFSVYLLGSKFFGRKVAIIGSVFLLMVFPIFELNLWGGYTTVLALAFMFLLFLFLPLAVKGSRYLVVTFFVAFSLVLSHQLATFVVVLALTPIVFYLLLTSRGSYLKPLIALVLGGGVAFFLYYFQAMLPYLDMIVEHVLFAQKTTVYQIPATTLHSFVVNFGFVFFIGLAGLFVAFFALRDKKEPVLFLILLLGFVVPFILAESYYFGLYLPFQWFIYYLMPSIIVLAGAFAIFGFDKFSKFYSLHRVGAKKKWVQAITVVLIVLVASTMTYRAATVYSKIMEGSVYYSTSDRKALAAGEWLKNAYPLDATVVATEVPGYWFRLFSGKTVIAQTNPIIQRNEISETVLDFSYEIENSLTLVRAYEAKGAISDEDYVSINQVWNRATYSSGDGTKVSYFENGVYKETKLSSFKKEILFDGAVFPKQVEIQYSNDVLRITKTVQMDNTSYPVRVDWSVTAVECGISSVKLYVSIFFDLHFSFIEAYVPGVLNWENPWVRPSDSIRGKWAVVDFSSSTLTAKQLGFYDSNAKVFYALEFSELPDWGNVGALDSKQIDALRFQYEFKTLGTNQTVSFDYRILTFSEDSHPEIKVPKDLGALFSQVPSIQLNVTGRDYRDYLRANSIKFIVYDRNQLDTKLVRSKSLELVYSNDRYVVFKIRNI